MALIAAPLVFDAPNLANAEEPADVRKLRAAVAKMTEAQDDAKNFGAPEAYCTDASINDVLHRDDSWLSKSRVAPGQACSNLYGFVCASNVTAERQKRVSRDYRAREIQEIINTMSDPAKSKAQAALDKYKNSKNLNIRFEDDPGTEAPLGKGQKPPKKPRMVGAKPGLLAGDDLAAFNKAEAEIKKTKGGLDQLVYASIAKKEWGAANEILGNEKKNLIDRLRKMQGDVENSYAYGYSDKRDRNHDFIAAVFNRMIDAVDNVELKGRPKRICFLLQRPTQCFDQ